MKKKTAGHRADSRRTASVSPGQVDRWCREGESLDLEFKRDAAALSREDIVAIANAGGGLVLLGVEEYTDQGVQRGRVVGLAGAFDKIRQDLNHLGRDCLPPVRPRINRVAHSKGLVVAVSIDKPPSIVCTPAGRYVIRVAGGNQPIDPAKLLQMLLDQEAASFLQRFRSAADEIVDRLEEVRQEIREEIESLRGTLDDIEALTMMK